MKRTYSDSPTALFCALETAVRTGNESAARKLRAQLAALGVVVEWRRPSHPTAVDALISDLARVTKERDEILATLREVTFRADFGPNDLELERRACETIRMLDPDKKGGE